METSLDPSGYVITDGPLDIVCVYNEYTT